MHFLVEMESVKCYNVIYMWKESEEIILWIT